MTPTAPDQGIPFGVTTEFHGLHRIARLQQSRIAGWPNWLRAPILAAAALTVTAKITETNLNTGTVTTTHQTHTAHWDRHTHRIITLTPHTIHRNTRKHAR